LWLDWLRPAFATTAVAALGWQSWLVWHRPPAARTPIIWGILLGTLGVNVLVALAWGAWWWRYR
jgi:hypothetical protein